MVVWAFSTALVRPVSAGMARTMSPMSDNALWGFIERAANWACPLALLCIQKEKGYTPTELVPGLGTQLACLDQTLNWPTVPLEQMVKYMGLALLAVWALVPFLRSRGPDKFKAN